MDVYFDTNVYGHIYRRQHRITNAVVKKLEEVVARGQLRIFTSYPVIEETNTARLSNLDEANGRLELIRTLAVQDKIIKHHVDLLTDDIQTYANGTPFPTKIVPPLPGLRSIFWDHTAKNYAELDKAAVETQKQIVDFSTKMNDSFNKIRPQAEALRKGKKQQPFPDYWNEMAGPWAEQVIDMLGLSEQFKGKSIKGLLDVHSFRIHTVAEMSLNYANTYERKTFGTGNSRDMHHVACASAVPIFVTHDGPLVYVLGRMPVKGLEVIDIHVLLKRL